MNAQEWPSARAWATASLTLRSASERATTARRSSMNVAGSRSSWHAGIGRSRLVVLESPGKFLSVFEDVFN